jgi:hypothetical protein
MFGVCAIHCDGAGMAHAAGLSPTMSADSDEFGRPFRAEVGHLFRLISAGRSD